jgi:hypothetical protein
MRRGIDDVASNPSLGLDYRSVVADEICPSGNDVLQLLVGLRDDAGEDVLR